MYKVRAKHNFTNVADKTTGRPREEGEIFTVDEERYRELIASPYDLIELLEKEEEAETPKKTRKKKTE